jgi:ABC-type nitrate/sulfonate/bicarbonate transport system ATPase subunit
MADGEAKEKEDAEFLSVEVEDIVQEYDRPEGGEKLRVLDGISLRLDTPGINMLLGPSGCGKSTLLRMMGGVRPLDVVTPTSGKVAIGGKPCDGPHEDSVMVFQRYANRPDLSVEENVAFPFRLSLWKKKVDRAEQKKRVDEMLGLVGLSDKGKLRPSQLSGGQNQRVALARALVLKPRILLMDEPFGALDAQTREEMQKLLASIFETQKCLIVFVTHDVSEALILGDRILVLSASPAKIVDDIVLDEPRPRSDAWLMSSQITHIKERIISKLHSAPHRGQVRVSV